MEIKESGIRDQIGYVCDDMVGSFVDPYVDASFLMFCTCVLGAKAIWAGTLFLFTRLRDALNDPVIDSLPDRWQVGKSGDKFKLHTQIAMIPLAVSGLLCFTDMSSFGSVAKYVQVAATYIFYDMPYTGTSISYGSITSAITNDPIERTKLSGAHPIGGTIIRIGKLSLVPQFTFSKTSDVAPSGFVKVAIVFGALFLLSYVLLLRLVTERVR